MQWTYLGRQLLVAAAPPTLRLPPLDSSFYPVEFCGANSLYGAKRHTLLLVEGEYNAMLCWQFPSHLCDLAILGSASNRASFPDLSDCAAFARPPLYPHILAIYDSDLHHFDGDHDGIGSES